MALGLTAPIGPITYDRALNIERSGHVVCHNRMVGFGDPDDQQAPGLMLEDFYGNEITSAMHRAGRGAGQRPGAFATAGTNAWAGAASSLRAVDPSTCSATCSTTWST